MSTAVDQSLKIVASVVPGHSRAAALPKTFPGMFLIYESYVYRYLEVFCKDYRNGYWDFIELSNGGFFMSLRSNSRFYLTVASNGYEGEMTAEAASLVVNLYALNQLVRQHKLQRLANMYHALYDYVCEHPEASKIIPAVS
jgi:hypothetical protein